MVNRLPNGSRMNREVHVRFCEGLGVKLPWSTHPRLEQGSTVRQGYTLKAQKADCHKVLGLAVVCF
jgi:hypothetical protein